MDTANIYSEDNGINRIKTFLVGGAEGTYGINEHYLKFFYVPQGREFDFSMIEDKWNDIIGYDKFPVDYPRLQDKAKEIDKNLMKFIESSKVDDYCIPISNDKKDKIVYVVNVNLSGEGFNDMVHCKIFNDKKGAENFIYDSIRWECEYGIDNEVNEEEFNRLVRIFNRHGTVQKEIGIEKNLMTWTLTERNFEDEDKPTWRNFWGDGGMVDIAIDCEDIYELLKKKSCVYWNGEDGVVKDSLVDRPSEYEAHGYTKEFEEWGIENVTKAIENGCITEYDILKYVRENN